MRARLLSAPASFLAAAATLLASLVPTPARAANIFDLQSAWLRPGESLNARSLDRLIDLMRGDLDANRLLEEVTHKLGSSDPHSLLKILQLADKIDGDENEKGRFATGQMNTYSVSLSPGGPRPWAKEVTDDIARSYRSRVVNSPLDRRVDLQSDPSICIRRDLTLFDAFGVLVHELQHFAGTDDFRKDDVLDYKSADDYLAHEVRRPGGELQAYVTQGGIMARLARQSGVPWRDPLRNFFDSDGNLRSEEALVRHILGPRELGGRGYGQEFRREFASKVVKQYNEAIHERDKYVSWLAVEQGNLQGQQLNTRHFAASGQLLEAQHAQDSAAFYQNYVGRIQNEIASLERRSRDIRERFPEFFGDAPGNPLIRRLR